MKNMIKNLMIMVQIMPVTVAAVYVNADQGVNKSDGFESDDLKLNDDDHDKDDI